MSGPPRYPAAGRVVGGFRALRGGIAGASTRSVVGSSVDDLFPKRPTLFRGPTQNYPVSPGLQRVGITPTSTDPAVATHGEQFGSGVVQIASPADLLGAKLYPPTLGALEAEVPVGMLPSQFAASAGSTLSSARARAILFELGVSVPGRFSSVEALNVWLAGRTPMTSSQIDDFIRLAAGG